MKAKELAAERANIREAEAQEALLAGRAELTKVHKYAKQALAGMRWRHASAVIWSGQPVSLFRLPSMHDPAALMHSATPVLQQARTLNTCWHPDISPTHSMAGVVLICIVRGITWGGRTSLSGPAKGG